MAEQQLAATVDQLLLAYGVPDAATWGPIISHLAEEAAGKLSPALAVAYGNLDPRFYIKVWVVACIPLLCGTVNDVCLPCSGRDKHLLSDLAPSILVQLHASVNPKYGPVHLACLGPPCNICHAALIHAHQLWILQMPFV